MAGKSTISITFKIDGDNKGFKDLANDAAGLKKVLTSTISEAERLNSRAINFAAIATGIDQMQRSISSVRDVLTDLTSGYTYAVEAETKLTTVMRQRMNASQEEVESIKKLALAEREKGVIDDDVQLMGAQQVATFLTQAKSIEVLLPAMNNLIAQQKGYSATGQDAVTIGNLMGKVMQGQVSALTRVGITFDEAEEKVLKFGTEEEKAAMLAQVITNNVGDMNATLGATDIGKQVQLEAKLGDIQDKLAELMTGALPFVNLAAEVTIALGSITTLITGLKSLKGALLVTTLKSKASAVGMAMLGLKASRSAAVMRIFSASAKSAAASTTALKLAVRGLLITTGVGVGIAALAAIIEKLADNSEKAADSLEESAEATEEYKTSAATAQAAINREVAELGKLIDQNKNAEATIKRLNAEYGNIFGRYQTAADWYDTLTKKSKLYTKQVGYEAEAKSIAAQIAQKEIEIEMKREAMADMKAKGTHRRTENQWVIDYNNAGQKTWQRKKVEVNTEEYQALIDDYNELMAGAEGLNKRMGVVQDKLQDVYDDLKDVRTATESTTKAVSINAMTWQEVSDAIAETDKKLKNTTDKGEIATLKAYNDQLERRKKILDNLLGYEKPEKVAEVKVDTAATEGIIGKLEAKIADARKRLTEATSEAAIEAINKEIETYEAELDKYQGLGKKVAEAVSKGVEDNGPIWKDNASTLSEIYDNIDILDNKLQSATLSEAAMLNQQIDLWYAKADAIRNAGRAAEEMSYRTEDALITGWQGIKGISSSIQQITDALHGNGSAWQIVVGIIDGFIGLYQGIQTVVGIIELLTNASAAHAAIKGVEATAETAEASVRTTTSAANVASSTATVVANKIEAASWKELAASQYMAAHAAIPFVGFGIAAGFTAAMLATTTAAGIPALAEGGVASGPTLALVGEYAGASGNPEVIAPLDKLRSLIRSSDSLDGGKVEFRIDGRTLVGILNKENNINRRG